MNDLKQHLVATDRILLVNFTLFSPTSAILGKTATLGVFCVVLICHSSVLVAAESSIQGFLDMGIGYDSNPTLVTNPESTNQAEIAPFVRFNRNTEASDIGLEVLLRRTNYSSGELNDTHDEIVSLSSDFRTSERTTWNLDATFRHDNVFQSIELPGTLPPDTDVALVDQQVPRNTVTISPSWVRRLSERNTLKLGYLFRETRYSNTPQTDLQNYELNLFETHFSRAIRPADDLNIIGRIANLRYPDTDREFDNAAILAGVTHRFSEVTRGTLNIGFRETKETTTTSPERTNGPLLEMGMTHRSGLDVLDGYFHIGPTASGAGQPLETTQFRMRWRRKISPKLNFGLLTNIFRQENLIGSPNERKYADIGPELTWQLRPRWFISGLYRYRYQEKQNQSGVAKSNAVFVTITYGFFGNPTL